MKKKWDPAKRIQLLFFWVFLLAFLLVGRLYSVQITRGEEFRGLAERQYRAPTQAFERGSIFFSPKDGEPLSAATLKSGYTIAINPMSISSPEVLHEELTEILPLDKEVFMAHAMKENDPYEEIAHRVSREQAEQIRSLDLAGVGIYEERWRFYPAESLAAHTLGFVGYDDDRLTGRYGLEQYYNDTLDRSSSGSRLNFFAEVFAGISSAVNTSERDSIRYGDLITTIEPTVQEFLERQLVSIVHDRNAASASGIIIHPKTGEIYAIGSVPQFDPNDFSSAADPRVFVNPLVESVFEVGSIMKPLTVAAGLDAGVITADTTYYDHGSITLDGARISNHDGKARGNVNMQEALSQSLNTGMVFIMQQLGKEQFSEYMHAFRLGEETGIDLPGETRGLIENLSSPRDVEHATASFGQGIAVTPIGMVRALSSLANGGTLIDPHIVRKIDNPTGRSWEYYPTKEKRVLKESTSEEITRMLTTVVDEALLGGEVKMEHYSIAAKTGTAQIPRPDGKGYYDDRYFHTFFGYFPSYDPQFLVYLQVEHPKGVRYASQTLTHPFMDTARFLLNYYEVPPDR